MHRLIPSHARVALGILAAFTILASGASGAPLSEETAEARLAQLLNGARAQAGLAPLARDPALDRLAQDWSAEMAATDRLVHRPDLAAQVARIEPDRRSWGENIAWRGAATSLGDGDVAAVHDGLVSSPGHYANIVGDFTRVGIGVTIAGGALWATFDFLDGPPLAAPVAGAPPGMSGGAHRPVGSFRVSRIDGARVRVRGWALDPDTARPIRVRVRVRPRAARTHLAASVRRGVARAYPDLGARHGFAITVRARPGERVCVSAIDPASGTARPLGCRRA